MSRIKVVFAVLAILLGAATIAAAHAHLQKADPPVDAEMHVSLSPLEPGVYKVAWRAVSIDTHVTEGNHTFTVREP